MRTNHDAIREDARPTSPAGAEEVLYHTERTRVARTWVAGGERAVVVKEPRGSGSAARLRHELSIIERLAGLDGIPRLASDVARPGTIAFEDTGGESVAAAAAAVPPDAVLLVELALAVARTLAGVHRRGVVHKDINPNNIIVAGSSWYPTIIDFDIASTFAEDRPGFTHASQIAGTLAYLAPEQTGRTGRGVDLRADLYSLGATLYALATGRPPFAEDDALELIHAHLAHAPQPPEELNPDVPAMLSAIILRLLEKEPDRRYQSAEGLASDLARLATNLARGLDAPFELGERDFPLRLAAPSRLIGRDEHTVVLQGAFDDVRASVRRAVLVSGAPGVGKTALIDQLKPVVTAGRGWFVTGKFDQYRSDADADGVRQALRALGRMLLAEPDTQLAEYRTRILDAVGPNAGLVAGVLPEFEVLLGVEPVAVVGGDPLAAEARIVQAGVDVLRAVASPEHPVVMVLDDLQWAAATPIGLVDAVVMDDSLAGLLLVGAYRDAEVGPTHPLTAKLARWRQQSAPPTAIKLDNLPPTDLAALLEEMLRLGPGEAAGLADAVGARTSGNPFDTVELVNGLRREGVLVPGEGGWTWDATTIRGYVGHGDVVDLLATRIQRLPAGARTVLQVMACLGGEVDLGLLAAATQLSTMELEEALTPPLEDGLLVLQRGAQDSVRFRHDRVQQAAHGTLDATERTSVHVALARRLAHHTDLQPVAAEQYLAATAEVSDPDERRQAAGLFRATAAAVRLINPAQAERFLAAAVDLLQAVEPAGGDLLIALDTERHAALYALGRLDEVDQVYAGIEARGASPLALATAACVQIPSLSARNRSQEAVELGLNLLRQLGLVVPEGEQVFVEIQRGTDALYRWVDEDTESADLQRPEVTDLHAVAIARLVNYLMPAAYYTGSPMMAWLVVEARRLWSEHGPCAALVGPIAHAGFVTIVLREDYHTGYRAVRRVLAASEARGYEPQTSQARFLFSLGSGQWFDPLDANVREAQRAHEGLARRGDLLNAACTPYASISQLLDSAATIDSFLADVDAGVRFAVRVGNDQAAPAFVAYRQLGRALRGETRTPGGFDDDSFDEAAHLASVASNPTAGANVHATRALAAAAYGDNEALVAHAAATVPLRQFIVGTYTTLTSHLVQALALAHRIRHAAPAERDELLTEFTASRDWLATRAAEAPANFTHLVRLVDAERAWALGDHWAAVQEYEGAVRTAQAGEHGWQTAFVTERAARFHLASGLTQTGRALLTEARRAYEEWGATGKVRQLDQENPPSRATTATKVSSTQRTGTIAISAETIDMLGILKASQALSSETNLDRLRLRVVETLSALAGATAVRLAVRDDESQGWLVPEGNAADSASIPLEEAGARALVPLSAFRYAERTRQPLLVEDATADHRFARDPYLAGLDSCSLLIVPVLARGALRAMLILENRLSHGAFSDDRLDAVKLIAGQLAVSIDNALVYASLEQKVAERTEALAAANEQLEKLSITDALTGLANRRQMEETLSIHWRDAVDRGRQVGIAMIDVDHFKLYNDRYGHVAGDRCLRRVAAALAENVRDVDLVARYGGEEFAIILPGATPEVAHRVAERVCAAVQTLEEPHEGAPLGHVTVSVGVAAAFPSAECTIRQLIERADGALYEAKRNGRNQVGGLAA
jgi:diguanylate cyclase (GGDEF)-like protein